MSIREIEGKGVRVVLHADEDASNPRTDWESAIVAAVPLETLSDAGNLWPWLEALGFDGPGIVPELLRAWDALGGEDGERQELAEGPGWRWEVVPGWPALADFGRTPLARWLRIFHGVEAFVEDVGEVRALVWLDPERCERVGFQIPATREEAQEAVTSDLVEYRAWAAGDVYAVAVEVVERWTNEREETREEWREIGRLGSVYGDGGDEELIDAAKDALSFSEDGRPEVVERVDAELGRMLAEAVQERRRSRAFAAMQERERAEHLDGDRRKTEARAAIWKHAGRMLERLAAGELAIEDARRIVDERIEAQRAHAARVAEQVGLIRARAAELQKQASA